MAERCENAGTPQNPAGPGGSNPEDENLSEGETLPPSPGFLEPILESDITLPTESEIELTYAPFSYSAAKSTWLFFDGCLLGTERNQQIITSEEEERTTGTQDDQGNDITYNTNNYVSGLFRVKPYWTRAIVDQFRASVDLSANLNLHSSRPVSARRQDTVNALEVTDNIRWISDTYWVNTEHREGPNEFTNSTKYEISNLVGNTRNIDGFDENTDFPDLVFLNSRARFKSDFINRFGIDLPRAPILPDGTNTFLIQEGPTVGVFYHNGNFKIRTGSPASNDIEEVKSTIVLRKINSDEWPQYTPINQWKNIEDARADFLGVNEQGVSTKPGFFKETYGVYELYQTTLDVDSGRSQLYSRSGDPISWNWYRYFYGSVRLEILESLLPSKTEELNQRGVNDRLQRIESLTSHLRDRIWISEPEEFVDPQGINRVKELNDINWQRVYNKNPQRTKGYNLNPYAVIPYYSKNPELFTYMPGDIVTTTTGFNILGPNVERGARFSPPTPCNIAHVDYTTRIPDLLTKDEAEILDLENKTYFDIRPRYSFYDCILENIINLGLDEIELPSPYRGKLDLLLNAGVIREEGLSRPTAEDYDNLMLRRIMATDNFFELDLMSRYDVPPPGVLFAQYTNMETLLSDISEQINDPNTGLNLEKIRLLAGALSDNYSLYGFDLLRNLRGTSSDPEDLEQIRDQQNLFLSIFSHEQLEDIYSQRHINSSFVEIEIGNIEKSLLAEAMIFDGDDNTLLKDLFFALEDSLTINEDFPNIGFEDLTRSSEDPYGFGTGTYLDIIRRNMPFSYVEQLVESGITDENLGLTTEFSFSDNISLSNLPFSFEDWWDKVWQKVITADNTVPPGVRFARIFKMLAIQSNIRRFVESNTRTYDEILNGKPAVSEVLGYVIKKFEILNDDRKRFISNIIVMANNDHDVQRMVDSQVKYGKIYQYEIHRVVAVVGNEYLYLDNMSEMQHEFQINDFYTNQPRFRMQFGLINKPSLQILLVPSERKRVSVVDRPPIHPDVDIIPFKNNQRNIMFNLSAQGGEYHAPPIILEDDDVGQFLRSSLNQGLLDNEFMKVRFASEFSSALIEEWILQFQQSGKIDVKSVHFRSDDPVKRFEVFRIDHHPENILDFRDNKIAVIETGAENASFMDTIEPDKPYYYIFRSEDIHNHVSNPTDIFEVELRTYGDAVYPSIRIVELKKYEREDTKELRQLIEIKPATDKQRVELPPTAISKDFMNKNGADLFSVKNDTLWNRRWKLRILSKNTGKEIDINFRFNPLKKGKENKKVNLIC